VPPTGNEWATLDYQAVPMVDYCMSQSGVSDSRKEKPKMAILLAAKSGRYGTSISFELRRQSLESVETRTWAGHADTGDSRG
jgi:hypothetical protein